MIELYQELIRDFDVVTIEDPLDEDDFEGFAELTEAERRSRSSATTSSSPTRSGCAAASTTAPPTRCSGR